VHERTGEHPEWCAYRTHVSLSLGVRVYFLWLLLGSAIVVSSAVVYGLFLWLVSVDLDVLLAGGIGQPY
jgi:hypothetical protein